MSNLQLNADWFSKPGDSIRSVMQRRGITVNALAAHLNGGAQALRGLLDGTLPIDRERAKVLAATLGGTRDFWLNRQAHYERALDRAVTAALREADQWLEQVPAPEAKRRGTLSEAATRDELRRRLAFFNVADLRSWQERYGRLCHHTRFRTSNSFTSANAAILLWLRYGELAADMVPTQPWDSRKLQDRLASIRSLSRIGQPTRFLPKLRALCAEAGVAVVIVKTPPKCHASGASRMVTTDKAMLLLSFRYRSDDQFWFTVFHEIGHLLLHGAKPFVDDDVTPEDDSECEANEFASRCVVPDNRFSEFQKLPGDRDSVLRFAVSVGVAPGLIVGQMQYLRMIEHNQLNTLKRRWKWEDIAPVLA
jgi:HTH-type transcriptional regulator / antitoxin HigA